MSRRLHFPGSGTSALHRTAKEITGALGEVRDRDVLLEALLADRSAAPLAEHPGIDRLIERVERERAAAAGRWSAISGSFWTARCRARSSAASGRPRRDERE